MASAKTANFRTTRRIEFGDTDAAGIAHFSRYFTLMEEAEHELLRSFGLSVVWERDGETISWPRVSASCDFSGSARFEDELTLEVSVERLGAKSVTYACRFLLGDREIALGKMTSVCCVIVHGQPPRSIEIPAEFRSHLEALA